MGSVYSERRVNAMDEPMTPPSPGLLFAVPLAMGLALAVGAACSSSSPSAGSSGAKDSGAPHTDAAGPMGQDASDDAADAAFSCDQGCPTTTLANATCVATVQASLVDATGAPVAGQDLLVCGDNLCSLPGQTDSQGATQFELCEAMVLPALKFLGGPSYVSFATAVTQANTTFAPITVFPLPSAGAAFPVAAGVVTSGPVTLAVAAGAVTFDPSQPDDANTQAFRAAQVDVTKVPAPFPASLGLSVIWGLAPVNATLTPSATLTIPNTEAWPAGSAVDFYMNGVEPAAGVAVPYGAWGPVGTGTVSQDGTTISTDTGTGNGIPVLSMVGVRLHQ
jgi:hypothetical protein